MWFSLGYMRSWSIKQEVLVEAHRVLRRKGIVSILASNIPESGDQHIFWGHFVLPDGTVSQTGYGVRGGQNQTLEKVIDLLKQRGFSIHSSKDNETWFEIQACKTE
jgi:ubiquinone/menaquinone biosynthesis C-methylase UbiE